nr:MAG TPA: hypothetical protein [Caudoviricetes sp.]
MERLPRSNWYSNGFCIEKIIAPYNPRLCAKIT